MQRDRRRQRLRQAIDGGHCAAEIQPQRADIEPRHRGTMIRFVCRQITTYMQRIVDGQHLQERAGRRIVDNLIGNRNRLIKNAGAIHRYGRVHQYQVRAGSTRCQQRRRPVQEGFCECQCNHQQ